MKGLRRLCQYSKAVEVDRLCDRELALSVPGTGKSHRTIILRQRFSSGPGQGYWVIYNCQHATYVLARRVSVGSVTVWWLLSSLCFCTLTALAVLFPYSFVGLLIAETAQ